jgi:hypothetical protein
MWEERFGADAYLYGTQPNDFLEARVAGLPAGRVLCLAEGEGRNAVFLAEQGHDVHSVDLTEAGVAKTLRLADERGVQVAAQVGYLAVFDIGSAAWAVVVSIFAHMPPHLTTYSQAIVPWSVSTPVTRPSLVSTRVTLVSSWILTPPLRAPRASAMVTSAGLHLPSFG